MAGCKYIPSVIRFTTRLADSIKTVTEAVPEADTSVQIELLLESSRLLREAQDALTELRRLDEEAVAKPEGREMAEFFHEKVVPAMAALRTPIDKLELVIDRDLWPVPTYAEMLFEI